jgi:hypothetical protein
MRPEPGFGLAGTSWRDSPGQPHECSGCGKTMRINQDTMALRRYPEMETTCMECAPFTVAFSYDGCAYCKTALAAVQDAAEAHTR